jgi:hypothetical protein
MPITVNLLADKLVISGLEDKPDMVKFTEKFLEKFKSLSPPSFGSLPLIRSYFVAFKLVKNLLNIIFSFVLNKM